MNDLDTALRATYQARSNTPEPPALLDEVLAIPDLDILQQRRWLPLSTGRFQSMFSATKFVAAGAIVALFGGFLLAGVLTQPSDDQPPAVGASPSETTQAEPTDAATSEPDPTTGLDADDTTTTPDLLSGVDLVTEEVEPGVYRVLSDGVRDLTEERTARIVYGQDGSVWLFRDKRFFRLGDADTHEWSNDKKKDASDPRNADDIEVGPDGVVWWADPGGKGLWSFDGQAWTLRREKPGGEDSKVDEVEVLPDGTVLASWRSNGSRKVARLDADGWEVFKTIDVIPGNRAILEANDAGDVWLQLNSSAPVIRHLYRGRYDEGSEVVLRRVKLPPESIFSVRLLDGTVWADAWGPILNFDGEIWTEDAYPGGHPEGGWPGESTPDGQLWYDSSCEVDMNALDNGDAYLHGCELVHFDGQNASRFELDDTYGYRKVAAPDGTLWLVLDAEQGGGLYVITPETVAAAE